jgi:hypothetical protein
MKTRAPVLLLLAALAASCGYKKVSDTEVAQPAYVFPHSTHLDADVACLNCHSPVVKSTGLDPNVRDVKLPAKISKDKACADCHDTEPTLAIPKRSREFRFRFDHAAHLSKVNNDCKRCHTAVPERGDTRPKVPAMAACTGCHKHQEDYAQARCTPCHVDLRGYKPETAFRHEGNWLRAHGALARPSAETCAQCHDQTYCTGCHSPATVATRLENIFPERVERSFIHRGDYVSRHMIEAGANPASCRRCHGSAFCDACHTSQGLTKFTTLSLRDPHPTGWANDKASGHFHGDAARRDISSCAGCHDQGAQAVCVGCHASNGPGNAAAGGNPHPGKFRSAHDRSDIAKNAMCRACHRNG